MRRILMGACLVAGLCGGMLPDCMYAGPAWAAETAKNVALATPSITTTQLLDKIAEAHGKVVVVNFFAAFCPPCRKEIPGLINIRDEISPDDLVFIGVAVDQNLDEMERFIARTGFNYPVFRDNGDVGYAFRVDGIPHNVVYDRQGRIVLNEAGYVPEKRFKAFLEKLIAGE